MLRSRTLLFGALVFSLSLAGLAMAEPADDRIANEVPGLRAPPTTASENWPELVIMAGPYARYREIVQSAAKTPPNSAEDLEQLMDALAAFDGAKLSRSFRAYTIIQAMQTPAFANGIQKWKRLYDHKGLISNLKINSAYAMQMPGYGEAEQNVLQSIRDDAQMALLAGGIYKDLAYSLQRQKWGTKVRGGKALRLATLRNAHLADQTFPIRILASLKQGYTLQPRMTPASPLQTTELAVNSPNLSLLKTMVSGIGPGPAYASTASQGGPRLQADPSHALELQSIMATAALHILEPGAPYASPIPTRSNPDILGECVDWARLHMNQCVSATRFVYEDSFCIARHQLKDSGRCIAEFLDGHRQATR